MYRRYSADCEGTLALGSAAARSMASLYMCHLAIVMTVPCRPVGWSGDGGVRESNKVELIKRGGGSRRGLRPLSPS